MSTNRLTAAGTAYVLAGTVDAAPSPDVERVIDAAAAAIRSHGGTPDLFVADHNHGDVYSEGSWSLAHEGAYDWPFAVDRDAVPTGLFVEPVAGWCLGVHPA